MLKSNYGLNQPLKCGSDSMSSQPHYPAAPITEAIIDPRVIPAEQDLHDKLMSLIDQVATDYPYHEEIFEAVGQMEIRPGMSAAATAEQHRIGFKGFSVDRKQIFQIRNNGYTFSRLAPYESWEPFRNAAQALWKAYQHVTQPRAISRLAVRYINRIDVPGDTIDLKHYFRTSPEVSPELPQKLDGFFLQLRLPFPDLPGQALINQTIIAPAVDGSISIVLDVDLFRSENVPQDEAGIWQFFEQLRMHKNEIFEACITDSARRLFNHAPDISSTTADN